MTRKHQPDQADFKVILPEDIEWKSFPAFPPKARLAILVGHPAEPAPYLIRVKAPGGLKVTVMLWTAPAPASGSQGSCAKMVVVEQPSARSAVHGQVYHRFFFCHHCWS
jgi:hypothetical protein